jgi:hypothetical protein
MTKYESQNNIDELYEIMHKRLKYLEKNIAQISEVNKVNQNVFSELKEAHHMVDLVRDANSLVLSECYINISKESIESSLKEAGILNRLGEMSKRVSEF